MGISDPPPNIFLRCVVRQGWMLHHNILTDTLIATIILLFLVWFIVACVFSLPVLVCFFYFVLLLCIPVLIFFLFDKKSLLAEKEEIEKLNVAQKAEVAATKLLYKRLLGYTVFVLLVFGTQLWPFYLGESYTSLVKQVTKDVGVSLAFWRPQWGWSLFHWPTKLALPEQVALGISLGFLGLEQVIVGWRWFYWKAMFVDNPTAWGLLEVHGELFEKEPFRMQTAETDCDYGSRRNRAFEDSGDRKKNVRVLV